jgi:hypothetical protein
VLELLVFLGAPSSSWVPPEPSCSSSDISLVTECSNFAELLVGVINRGGLEAERGMVEEAEVEERVGDEGVGEEEGEGEEEGAVLPGGRGGKGFGGSARMGCEVEESLGWRGMSWEGVM